MDTALLILYFAQVIIPISVFLFVLIFKKLHLSPHIFLILSIIMVLLHAAEAILRFQCEKQIFTELSLIILWTFNAFMQFNLIRLKKIANQHLRNTEESGTSVKHGTEVPTQNQNP